MKEKKDEKPLIVEIKNDDVKDPKSGKTISRKAAFFAAGGSLFAGSSLGLGSAMRNADPIEVDTNDDLIADTILTDENNDGIYETSEAIQVPDGPEMPGAASVGQPFDTGSAPHSGAANDDMSFSQAFSSAREELGPGGVFSWQGQDYTTFYAEEVDDQGNPIVEYDTVDSGHQANIEADQNFDDHAQAAENTGSDGQEVHVIGLDNDQDGTVETYVVDVNLDGSADAVYVDGNLDGQITEDEVQIIHDPSTLEMAENPTDGSMISVDTNADGVDDILLADLDGDQVADAIGVDQNQDMVIDENEVQVLNEEAFQEAGYEDSALEQQDESGQIEYDGEVANDMPDDVPDADLDNFSGDITNLEDNFADYNEWV